MALDPNMLAVYDNFPYPPPLPMPHTRETPHPHSTSPSIPYVPLIITAVGICTLIWCLVQSEQRTRAARVRMQREAMLADAFL